MSEQEIFEHDFPPQQPKPAVRERYKSTKSDADKRKQTSKSNMQKAREAKNARLAEEKEMSKYQYEIPNSEDDYTTDSSSDEELVIARKPRKPTIRFEATKMPKPSEDRMDKFERMLMQLAQKASKPDKKKRRPIERKTVIQITQPTQQSNPYGNELKHKLLNL